MCVNRIDAGEYTEEYADGGEWECVDRQVRRVGGYGGRYALNPSGDIINFTLSGQEIAREDQELFAQLSEVTMYSLIGTSATDEFVQTLESLQKVREIFIQDGLITSAALESFARHPELRILTTRRCLHVESLEPLTGAPNLERLTLLYNSYSSGMLMNALPNIPNLRHLDLRGIPMSSVTPIVLGRIAQIEGLQTLRVRQISERGVARFRDHPNLRTLELQDVDDLSPDMAEVFHSMPNLRGLTIFRSAGFGAAGTERLAGLQLESLELRDISSSPAALQALHGMTTLRTLGLSELSGVSSDDVLALLHTLPNLNRVIFFSMPVDDTIAEHLAMRPMIRNVNMSLTQLSDRGLAALATLDLTHLSIFGNVNNLITVEGARVLANCTNLQVLVLPVSLNNAALIAEIRASAPRVNVEINAFQ